MQGSNSQQIMKFIFLPALLLSVFLSGSSTLFLLSQHALIGKQLGFAQIPALKVSTIIPQVILVVLILFASATKPFEKVFKGSLITLTGMMTLLIGLMFLQGHVEVTGVPDSLGSYKPLVMDWPLSLLYIGLSLMSVNLFPILIWGFINRCVSISDGIKYYIPFALVLGLGGTLIANLGFKFIGGASWSLMVLLIPAILLMACSYFVFKWSWKRLPQSLINPESESSASKIRFPYLSTAYLLAGCVMVNRLLDIPFKHHIKTLSSDLSSYSKMMGYYSTSLGSTTITISIVWAVLGTWLILKKGWKTTAFYAFLSTLVGAVAFFSFPESWLNQGIFVGILSGTTTALFFPLIQILYLYIPSQNRLKTKIVTEMIALPLLKGIPKLAMMGLLMIFGSVAAITFYLKILVPILIVLLVIAIKKANTKLVESIS